MNLRIPTNKANNELIFKKSRFISLATKVKSTEEVKEIVTKLKNEHPNANHVVHAAIIGNQGTIYSYSDDKEPKNTAGRPAFEVLKGSGLTNIGVFIIRYFGGTLLGTGGLVKAYGESAKEVLKKIKSEELIKKSEFIIKTSYDRYEKIKIILDQNNCLIENEDFNVGITIKGTLAYINCEKLKSEIIEMSNAKDIIEFTDLPF
jgi:uncharacterized YigZ family protein